MTDSASTSRRDMLKAAAWAGAAAGLSHLPGCANSKMTDQDGGKLDITMAGYPFDRVKALQDGRVQVERCRATFEVDTIGRMNTDVFSGKQSRHVTEIGLSPYMLAYANEGFRDYTLLPIFPLRLFRHKSVFIRNDRGIDKPQDLRGKRIGTPGYSSTSLTWIRGIMQHEYGVNPNDVQWVIASKDSSAKASGSPSKQEQIVPEGLSIQKGPPGKDESQMLVDGDVDALFHAAEPKAYTEGHPKVARLFPDPRQVERAYFAKTGIFPIMHAVAMPNRVVDAHPWLPEAVFNAYCGAKRLTYQRLNEMAWVLDSLPWIGQEVEETRKLMGDNYWPYGIEPNRKALDALFQYSHEQGLASRRLTIEELFHPSTLALADTA